jgi:hypothetical protein
MKKIIIGGVITFAVALLAPQIVQAQGTMAYLSNLDQPSIGSEPVGSDSWIAAGFRTGTNASGYLLNSIQLGMTDAAGNPSGFTVMIWSSAGVAIEPGRSIGTLNGSLDPTPGGDFTYTPASSLLLFPQTFYFIMLNSGTAVASGAYEWSLAGANAYNPSGGWTGQNGFWIGSSWSGPDSGYLQYAINATAVREPATGWLVFLGGGLFVYARRKLALPRKAGR